MTHEVYLGGDVHAKLENGDIKLTGFDIETNTVATIILNQEALAGLDLYRKYLDRDAACL